MSWIYRYETKGIQSWILEGNLLRDLAGGSALIESLTQEAAEAADRAGASRILQATSGAMTALFPSLEALQAFASEWPMWVACRAPGLHLVQAWVRAEEGLRALFQRLAETRNRVQTTDFEVGPWVLRAGRSGLPAVPTPRDIRTEARLTALDPAALAKERGRMARRDSDNAVTGGVPWSHFAEDLDRWSEGPVAVIHADGSGVGQRLIDLDGDMVRLSAFSDALRAATTEAIRIAVDWLPRGRQIMARPVVSAGDDLTYILPADHARSFATTWLEALENRTHARRQELGGSRIHGGAGIVYVHKRYPFAQAYQMAESLCSEAKRALKKDGRPASVLAFRRVTTAQVEEAAAETVAWVLQDGSGLAGLSELCQAARVLPRGTLRTWLGQIDRGDAVAADKLWNRAREVADPKAWERFASALEATGGDPTTGRFRADSTVAIPLESKDPLKSKERATPVREALSLLHVEKSDGRSR